VSMELNQYFHSIKEQDKLLIKKYVRWQDCYDTSLYDVKENRKKWNLQIDNLEKHATLVIRVTTKQRKLNKNTTWHRKSKMNAKLPQQLGLMKGDRKG
jgi:hypothetical protein